MTEKNHFALFGELSVQNLEANQRWRLTPEQKSALKTAMKDQRTTVLFGVGIVLALIGFFSFFICQVAGVDGLLSSASLIIVGLILLGVIILILSRPGGDPFLMVPRDDIENGQVESVVGKVLWTGRRYKFVSDSRKLKSTRFGRALPPPGDYRFYCLPRSGLVVIAEELWWKSTGQPKDLLLKALARANHFSMQDLVSIREGTLRWRQEFWLFKDVLFVALLLAVFISICLLAVRSQVAGKYVFLYLFLALPAAVTLLQFTQRSINLIRDIWDGKVAHMDGQVTRHAHRARYAYYYLYQLNDIKFDVSMSAYNALIEGRQYRVYFTPRAKHLVAIEPIG